MAGTAASSIDMAEAWNPPVGQNPPAVGSRRRSISAAVAGSVPVCQDRSKFSEMCDNLGIDQPEWSAFVHLEAPSEGP